MSGPLDVDRDEVQDLWEAGFGSRREIKKAIENRKMRELIELAQTLDELKPVLLNLVERQGHEL